MPEVTRRRTGELLRKLFEILLEHSDGLPAREALLALASRTELTEYEKGMYESGGRRFEKIVRFATVDCVKAGWLLKHKGTWSITDEGRAAYQSLRDPEAFYRRALKLYYEWRASQQPERVESGGETVGDEGEGKTARITFEEAEEQAWGEIEQHLKGINPYELQDLVAALLRGMGYHVSWIAPPGKDGGIDILAWSDPLGTRPPRIKVQVKALGRVLPQIGRRRPA